MDQGLHRAITLPVPSRGRLQGGMAAAPIRREKWASEGWRQFGSCRDSDPDLFYPVGRGHAAQEQTEVAKSVCRSCPSREPCLAFALGTRQDLGVWGGMSPDDRRELIRARRRAVAS
jgi:WhiB family redox-sensing transcriptional regulator